MSSMENPQSVDKILDRRCTCTCGGQYGYRDKKFHCRRERNAYAKGFLDALREVQELISDV